VPRKQSKGTYIYYSGEQCTEDLGKEIRGKECRRKGDAATTTDIGLVSWRARDPSR